MDFVHTLIILIIVYLCVYALLNRICKCVEYVASIRAFFKCKENGLDTSLDELEKTVRRMGSQSNQKK